MQVILKNALYFGNEYTGTFETNGTTWWDANPHDPREGKVNAIIKGKSRMVWVNRDDFEFIYEDGDVAGTVKNVEESAEEMRERIAKRFMVMDKMSVGLVKGTIRSLIISGAPGIGKTFTLERKLKHAHEVGEIDFSSIKGKCSAIGLYIHLWENREDDCVVLLDDVDVFSNEDTLNVLKAALDTGEERIVSWGTASNYLAERDIPNNFEFKGSVVFITNADIDAEVARGSKLAPHLDALQSRSIYLDLGVHTSREIMIRVEDVITKTDMLQKRGLTEAQTVNALEWMKEHTDRLRSVSLRTALYLADFINTDSDWADVAEVTLLK
ncbi:nrdC.10 hypothetical protein [Aeromonas phage 31]|uniref:Uncharacterized protein n=4 Tax=Biquartavirus TaxID=1912143 RepID=Q6U972_9CAUD|nr:hypothetical protein ST44RRORF230c [Aeromonas phage 44RR2.8t]YP_238956.1 hypothetical protein PHG31p227 [Aeromonas phage 31]APU00702.1 thioredoxin [Aeromonas phage 44RR2.8t.2]APU01120.1 thioredoxin [Aeromonas phage 31.2]APU02031.1 thioredoxin [Aeromonas phage L9-6]APU02282.1 thioredoxin [Aeromonas phage Riv-10]APU02530.1 thioredoxin [Aeromonas phage SW69-9]UYD59540.1 hypothetical protein JNMOADIG_00011 [Aeromonas phage avDM5]UYD60486.1 hypothetical protein NPHMPGLK_00151 [Aeromonas phage